MPLKIIKSSFEYCAENKLFFAFMLILFFVCQYIIDYFDLKIIGPVILAILMMGYGLQVTQDIINGGKKLPEIKFKKIISFGFKGYFISIFYLAVQIFFLAMVSANLNFPNFELEEMILNYSDSINLFLNHDPVSFFIFIGSGFAIVYVTSFFMELSLARLADGGKVTSAFKFHRIKHAIDIIGWRSYSLDYTKIIFSIVFLTFLIRYEFPVSLVDGVIDGVLSFLVFVIQYIGIGEIYKVYVDSKSD